MTFKAKKIVAAVAAGLGVSVAGLNMARADEIMFPYFYVGDTVTSIVTVMNRAGTTPGGAARLHYRFYYKEGANADNLDARCVEGDQRRITSRNDVVTFDLSGKFGDDLAVLAEPANRQVNARYAADNRSFAFMKGAAKPARGFMLIDNNALFGAEGTIAGEIFMMDFVEGAVWGYAAYNAAPSATTFDFSDAQETAGEVLAGPRFYASVLAANNAGNGHSAPVPVGILPVASTATTGDVFTRFFVTPINHAVNLLAAPFFLPPVSDLVGRTGQEATALTTRVGLSVFPYTGGTGDTAFDRDEIPVSSSRQHNVTCVGAIAVENFFSSIVVNEFGDFGGWSGFRVTKPGPLVDNTVPAAPRRTLNTNEAVVTKLEYNPSGKFIGSAFKGAFNNSIWLRRGHRESINFPAVGDFAVPFATEEKVAVYNRFIVRSANDPTTGVPIDVGQDYTSDTISENPELLFS